MLLRRFAIVLSFTACGSGAGSVPTDAAGPGDGSNPVDASNPEAASDGGPPDASEPGTAGVAVPYDQVTQKSVHNSYERGEPLLDQLVYHRVRSLELDIHSGLSGSVAAAGDWFVYHNDLPGMRTTSCTMLSDCLAQLAAFHRAVPEHEVVTIFVDLKDAFATGHQPVDLDETLARVLGRQAIVAPSDLLAACPTAKTVREAVTQPCSFPTLAHLRGKFMLATTGGTLCDKSLLADYATEGPTSRLAFVAAGLSADCPFSAYQAWPDIVFFNLPFAEKARAAEARAAGFVVRIYNGGLTGGLDDATSFADARTAGAMHLATDKVNVAVDPWASTQGPHGFPFSCAACGDELAEVATVLGVRAASGDQWADSDSSFLAYETGSVEATYTALVSVPSSHVEPWAKACLVARSSDAPNAANVAVCRMLDTHAPRAQLRPSDGATTVAMDAPSFSGLSAESPAFLRLKVAPAGAGSIVTTSASSDGVTWSMIAETAIAMPLPVRGIAVSSHGTEAVKAVFVNLTKTDGAGVTPLRSNSLVSRALGATTSGAVFDGVFEP